MKRNILLIFSLILNSLIARGQNEEAYLKANAIHINNPERLSDSVYNLLSKFQIIMFGEMHGTNESVPFVNGLTTLFTTKGDSVLVGLEIPSNSMARFISAHTDSSIYQSDFFSQHPVSGKESIPWANLISSLNRNHKVQIFFFDLNADEKISNRDSLMAMKTKRQYEQHSTWKMITLTGNYHNRITNPGSMTSILKRNITTNICSLNMEYQQGSAFANFTHGMEIKELGSYPSTFNSTQGYDRYVMLQNPNIYYDYDGFYFIRSISPAKMTISK